MKIKVCLGLCSFHIPHGPLRPVHPSISWRLHGECGPLLCPGGMKETPQVCLPVLKAERTGITELDCSRGRQHLWGSGAHPFIPKLAKLGHPGLLHEEKGTLAMLFQDNNHSGWLLAFVVHLIF